MTISAKIINHNIKIPEDIDVDDGTEVKVIIEKPLDEEGDVPNIEMALEALKELYYSGFSSNVDDGSENHDKYLYGEKH